MQLIWFLVKEMLIKLKFILKQAYRAIPEIREEIKELNRNGIFIEKNYFSQEKCARLRLAIDGMLESGNSTVWRDSCGADSRIYFADTINNEMKSFFENDYIRRVLKAYLGINNPVGMVLAAKIEYNSENIGSGGGWHRDSPFNHQFKAIVYLNDVSDMNGPFQYVPKSHVFKSSISSVLEGFFSAGQYRYTEAEVDSYLVASGLKVCTMQGQAGDLILVDTKGIHRGKPLVSGSRYALFCYFWEDSIPEHFDVYRQV